MQPVGVREYGDELAVLVAGPGGPDAVARCLRSLGDPPRVLVTAGRSDGRAAPGALGPGVVDPGAVHPRVLGPGVRDLTVLELGEDLPRPAAVNRAVAALDPTVGLVLVTEPGVRWADGARDALAAGAAGRPRAGLLAPRLDGPVAAPLPGRWVGDPLLRALSPTLGEPVPGAAVLLRRAALDSVAGYDATLPTAIADRDLAARMRAAGWLTLRLPAAAAFHDGTGDGTGETGAEHHRGTRRYLAGRHGRARGAALAAVLAARSRTVRARGAGD